jgi:RNA polymerase sigma-70 factor (ECF subfamily)
MFTSTIEQDERRLAVEAALAGLPKDQAEVLVMKVWGGLTFGQIATALDVSANTIASRYRYAISKLREQLVEGSML